MSENALGGADSSTERSHKDLLEDADWLYRQYCEKGLSYSEIGERLDVTASTVWRYAQDHEIESRSYGEFQVTDDRLKDADWLHQKYIVEDWGTKEIADECSCSADSVHYWREQHGIECKREITSVDERLDSREWLREKYIEEELTIREIAELVQESYSNVHRRLVKHGVERREAGFQPGEDHFNYLDGSTTYYGPNWEEQRREALERDDYECRGCGVLDTDAKRSLHVHHIRRIKWFKDKYSAPEWYEEGNNIDNLLTLCEYCHPRWEGIPLKPQ